LQGLREELTRAREHVEELKQINAGLEQSFRLQREGIAEASEHQEKHNELRDGESPDKLGTLDVLRASLRQERGKLHDTESRYQTAQQQLAERDEQYAQLRQSFQKLETTANEVRLFLCSRRRFIVAESVIARGLWPRNSFAARSGPKSWRRKS
jgi:chromosome segregation ATPase